MNEEKEIDKNSKAYKFAAGKGVMNLPNKLTISRMCMIPAFIALFYVQFLSHYLVALAVFAIACLTDLFDGKIARKYKLVTNLGKFLDPIADKVLVLSALVIMLTVPQFFTLNFGQWALIAGGCGVALILAREIIVSGFRMVAAGAGKYKTVCQDISIVVLLIAAGFGEFASMNEGVRLTSEILNYIGLGFFALAVLLTVISGVNYIVKNIQVLKQ